MEQNDGNTEEAEVFTALSRYFGYQSFKSDLQRKAVMCAVKSEIFFTFI